MKRFVLQGMLASACVLASAYALTACGGGGGGTGGATTTGTTSETTTGSDTTSMTGTGGTGTTSSTSSTGTTSSSSTSSTTATALMPLIKLPVASAPYGITLDDTNVYWTEQGATPGTGRIMQAKKDGTSQVVIATAQDTPRGIAVGNGEIYWGWYSANGGMFKAPIGGGTVTTLLPLAPAVLEIVVDSTYIWWTREPDDIQRMPVAGLPDGGVEDLLSANPLSNGLTKDDVNIFWCNQQDGYIKKGDHDLGNETPLQTGDVPWGVAVDATNLYWTEQGSGDNIGRVMKASKVDGSNPVELAGMQGSPNGITVDATHVYFANRHAGTINKVPIAGGAVVVLATDQEKPVKLVVDGTHVYWANTEGDAIYRVAK